MNKKVDIITSSGLLAVRDSEEHKKYYEILGIDCTHNILDIDSGEKKCYSSKIVYGDAVHF